MPCDPTFWRPAGALQSETTSEDVKGAAALALGGVAVGNLGAYLPALLASVRQAVSTAGGVSQVLHVQADTALQNRCSQRHFGLAPT